MLGVQIVGMDHMIVTAKAEGGANFQLSAQIGSRFPALISATGRCLAAYGNIAAADLAKRFATLRWDNPPAYADWLAQVAETVKRGYAVDPGNYIAGVTVIAAPVWRGSGIPSHALVAIALDHAIQQIGGAQPIGEVVVAAAQSLSRRLSGALAPDG